MGEVVAEDEEWIRLVHSKNDVEGTNETWDVDSIRKADITRIEELH